ncbi:LytR/AlgR family response regulator transcription factor [Patiriisocius sp. Uisw_017]|jgi:two-component system LytT family response regulator|uniref:LytR/AlgR family response regulator transcription factor n=1 Tax=Patiriisocius sp. Uisw_017 TaxID=3230968 RepID=UPI0039EA989D
MIPTNDGFLFINYNESMHVEGYDGYTKIHLENTSEIVSSYNIGKFEKMVTDNFYKCHKSHIINLHKVAQFKNEGYIILENRKTTPVSKANRKEFLQLFAK